MNIEELSKILHEGTRTFVKGKEITRDRCTFYQIFNHKIIRCINGQLFEYLSTPNFNFPMHEECKECQGTGYKLFIPWENLTEEQREGIRNQAAFLQEHVSVFINIHDDDPNDDYLEN